MRTRAAGRLRLLTAGAVLMPLAAAAQTGSCEPPLAGATQRVESDRYVVAFSVTPAQPAVGEHFALDAGVCAKAGAPAPTRLRIDAWMPDHRHGMNYRPKITARGGGRFHADGFLFHMPGRWQYVFDVEAEGGGERLTRDAQVR